MSAVISARSTRRTEGVDAFGALQRVLNRSAKQKPKGRFHALYDKVARRDVLERAWAEVRANRGAPGIYEVSVGDVERSGVACFLEHGALELCTKTYRLRVLRRVDIPNPGRPGQTLALGIPTVRDRVV